MKIYFINQWEKGEWFHFDFMNVSFIFRNHIFDSFGELTDEFRFRFMGLGFDWILRVYYTE